ncbi:MAG: hypothetical protein Q7S16_03295 [bacterium]|nr:hypothetical protein [bacterium]
MPPTPDTVRPPELTRFEKYDALVEKQGLTVEELRKRFDARGEEADKKIEELLKMQKEIIQLYEELSEKDDETDLVGLALKIEAANTQFIAELKTQEDALRALEKEGTDYEKADHRDFLDFRNRLLDEVNKQIDVASNDSVTELLKKFKDIRNKILAVSVEEDDDSKKAIAEFRKRTGKDPDKNAPLDMEAIGRKVDKTDGQDRATAKKLIDKEKRNTLGTLHDDIRKKTQELVRERKKKSDKEKKEKDVEDARRNKENDVKEKKRRDTIYEGSTFEKKNHPDFVKQRRGLLDDVKKLIERVKDLNNDVLKIALEEIRTNIFGVDIKLSDTASDKIADLNDLSKKLKDKEPEIIAVVKIGSASEQMHHDSFVKARTDALQVVDDFIVDAKAKKFAPEIQSALVAIQKDLLLLGIGDDEAEAKRRFAGTHAGTEATPDDPEFQKLLADIIAENKKEGDDALAALQTRLDEAKAALASEAKQKKEKGVTDRAGRQRELLQKVTGRESLTKEDIEEKLKTQFPELLASILNGFTGAPGETKETLKAKREDLLLKAAWKLFSKEGYPENLIDDKAAFLDNREIKAKIVDSKEREKEYARYGWWKETVRTMYTAAQERIQQEAAARITQEKIDKGIKTTIAKNLLGYGGASIAVKLAAGTALLNPFSSIAIGVGITGIAAVRLIKSWREASHAQAEKGKVAQEWKGNEGAQEKLQARMTEALVDLQRHKKREDDALATAVNVKVKEGYLGKTREGTGSFQEVRAEIAKLQNPWQEEQRNDLIGRYKQGIDTYITDTLKIQVENQIKQERTGDKAEALSPEEIAIVDSVCRAYRMEQMNRLVENETKEHLSGIARQGMKKWKDKIAPEPRADGEAMSFKDKVLQTLRPGDEIDERFKQGVVMSSLGLLAYGIPGIRQALMSYGGMKMGGAAAEMAWRKIEKKFGKEEKASPTAGDLVALQQAILAVDAGDKSAVIALREKVTVAMADVRVYLQSEGALKHTLGNVELRRSLEELENMVVAQSAELGMDDKNMDLLWKAAREKQKEVVGRESRRASARLVGSVAGLAAGFLVGDYMAHAAEQAKANAEANESAAKLTAEGAETSTSRDLENATVAAKAAAKNMGVLKTLADNKDWANADKTTLHDLQKAIGDLTDTPKGGDVDEPLEALQSVVGEADKAANAADGQLQHAMETAARAHQSADMLAHVKDIGNNPDSEKWRIAHAAADHAAAADKTVQEIAAKAAEAHHAANEAHALQEHIKHALEVKATGEPFSENLQGEYKGYYPIGETPASGSGGASASDERWFGGDWNAEGGTGGEKTHLRYELLAKNFMNKTGISVKEGPPGELLLGHDNENVTFHATGSGHIEKIEIKHFSLEDNKVLSDGKAHECISITTEDNNHNVRVIYIQEDGQHHGGDVEGNVPNTGSLQSQAERLAAGGPLTKATEYISSAGAGDKVTGLHSTTTADGHTFLSASEIKGADGVVRHLDLVNQDGNGIDPSDANPDNAIYHYTQPDPHDVSHIIDQGLMGKDGTVSAASIHDSQVARGASDALAIDSKDPKAIADALKNITDNPVGVTNRAHEIVYARIVDGSTKHVETTSVDFSKSFPHDNVTVVLNADKTVDIKVGDDVVSGFDDKSVALDAGGKITIDGKNIEAINKAIGDAILNKDVGVKLPGVDVSALLNSKVQIGIAAELLGIHAGSDHHLDIPQGMDKTDVADLLKNTEKLTACGDKVEHLRFALDHKGVSAPALTEFFRNPTAQIPVRTTDVALDKVFGTSGIVDAIKSGDTINQNELAFALKHSDLASLQNVLKADLPPDVLAKVEIAAAADADAVNKIFNSDAILSAMKDANRVVNPQELAFALGHKDLADATLQKVLESNLPPEVLGEASAHVNDFARVFSTSDVTILNACKINNAIDPDRVIYALRHGERDVAALTALFKEQDLFRSVLEKPVSLDQAQDFKNVFPTAEINPTKFGGVLVTKGTDHFLITKEHIQQVTLGGDGTIADRGAIVPADLTRLTGSGNVFESARTGLVEAKAAVQNLNLELFPKGESSKFVLMDFGRFQKEGSGWNGQERVLEQLREGGVIDDDNVMTAEFLAQHPDGQTLSVDALIKLSVSEQEGMAGAVLDHIAGQHVEDMITNPMVRDIPVREFARLTPENFIQRVGNHSWWGGLNKDALRNEFNTLQGKLPLMTKINEWVAVNDSHKDMSIFEYLQEQERGRLISASTP